MITATSYNPCKRYAVQGDLEKMIVEDPDVVYIRRKELEALKESLQKKEILMDDYREFVKMLREKVDYQDEELKKSKSRRFTISFSF